MSVGGVGGHFRDFVDRLAEEAGDLADAAREQASNLLQPLERVTPPRVAPPSPDGRLKVMTYNVMRGGRDYPGILAALRRANPDVTGLQEISRENAERLARDLGMHMVFFGQPHVPGAVSAGKAILSKYPIAGARHETLGSLGDHAAAIRRAAEARDRGLLDAVLHTELAERRGVLEATVVAGGRKITFLDTHLSLGDAKLNAKQMAEIAAKAEALRAQGSEVVLVGDFNANLALRDGAPTTPGKAFKDATDTVAEYRARYGKAAGNMQDPADRAAAARLRGVLGSAWDLAPKKGTITAADENLTPEEARALLASRKPRKGSDEWKRLTAAADGFTHLGANKRFDDVLVSGGLKVTRVAIDQTTAASDHQPVIAEIDLRSR